MTNRAISQNYINLNIDINSIDQPKSSTDDPSKLMYDVLKEWWPSSYLSNLDPEEYIPAAIEQWMDKYINSDITKEVIEKIKDASPHKDIKIKLVIDLLMHDGVLKLEDDIPSSPMFKPYVLSSDNTEFSLGLYYYDRDTRKFENWEPTDVETMKEEGLSQEFISNFHDFHNRLLKTTSNKLKLYTSQPETRIREWNKQKYIPTNSFFTDNIKRAEYYFDPEEHDIIVSYKIPENELIMTSDFGGAKEYVTINNVKLE